jgi:hypothetical protein
MGKIQDLLDCAEEFSRSQTERLNNEVRFIEAFPNVTDTLKNALVDQIMNRGFLSATVPSTGLSDLFALTDLISDPVAAPDFITQQSSLVRAAIDKVVDASLPTGVSDALSDSLQSFVQATIGNSSVAALEAVQNRVAGLSQANAQQQLANTSGRSETVPFGSPSAVEEVKRSTYDASKRSFNTAYALTGLVVSADPSSIFGLTDQAIANLGVTITGENDRLVEAGSLIADIVILCAEFTAGFYDVANTENIANAQNDLLLADSQLINVRSKMLNLGIFDSFGFNQAKASVENAQDDLDQGLGVNPKISEINSKLDRLEKLLQEIQSEHGGVLGAKANVEGSINFWLQDRIFGALFAGQIQNVQTEIRSIIDSMESGLDNPRRGIIIPLIAVWRAQILLILQTMCALPDEISKYLDDDPNGFRVNLQVTIDALAALTDEQVDLLVAQGQAFIDSVRRKLVVPVAIAEIEALALSTATEIATTVAYLASVESVVTSHVASVGTAELFGENLISLFDSLGMDRAASVLRAGDFTTFFSLTAQTSSFTGALLSEIDDLIICLQGEPGTTQTGLVALQEIQDFVFNTKRAEELLTTTFGQFRDNAIDDVTSFELPQIQSVDASVKRVAEQLVGGPCDT